MGQKINPNGYRYGINKNWQSRWIAKDAIQTGQWLNEDDKVRKYLFNTYRTSQIDRVEIERTQSTIDLFVYCGQPGIILGKDGENLKKATEDLRNVFYEVSAKLYQNANPGAGPQNVDEFRQKFSENNDNQDGNNSGDNGTVNGNATEV